MAGTRTVTYASVSSPGQGKTVYSAAATRDELYTEFPELELLSKGMKAWVRDGSNATDKGYGLTDGYTKLPEGNIVLYFLVDKNDSGRTN